MKQLTVRSRSDIEFIDITSDIKKIVKKSGISTGKCTVYVPHTTAAVTVNENVDLSVQVDILKKLNELVPLKGDYQHIEGNSAAHIKSSLLGISQTFFVENGNLILGRWQGIFFCEFDGPRERKVLVSVL
jgi:secondary thiamine-phosphate synthase enzyme